MSEKEKFIEQSEKILKALREGAKKHDIPCLFYGYVRMNNKFDKVMKLEFENDISYMDGLIVKENIQDWFYNSMNDDE